MNKRIIKRGLFILLILGMFSIYGLRGNVTGNVTPEDKWRWPDSIKNILIIPRDSLLAQDGSFRSPMEIYTPEQKALARLITSFICDYTEVENNRFVFKLSREEFLKTGTPEAYYDEIVFSFKSTNDFMDKDTLNLSTNLTEMWEKAKAEMRKQMFEEQK